jgi:putative transcriptional regulator
VGKCSNTATLVSELRLSLGLIQEKLAAKLGVTFTTINRWENGRSKPSPLALKQIEDLLAGLGKKAKGLRVRYFGEGKV